MRSSLSCTGLALLSMSQLVACAVDVSGEPGVIATGPVAHVDGEGTPVAAELEQAAVDYALALGPQLGLAAATDFAARPAADGADGMRRTHLQQLHDGVPVVGSHLVVHAEDDSFYGLAGVLTHELGGFDVEPTLSQSDAAAIALEDARTLSPDAASLALGSAELVIEPRREVGADLVWRLVLAGGESARWHYRVHAEDGRLLGASLETAAALAGCGDGVCDGSETDESCAQDCGCSAPGDLCGSLAPAPFGCWCDAECAATGDCCADVDICELSPAPDGGQGAPCEWGEKEAGFFDGARLSFYRSKYFWAAQGALFVDADEAREYLLHFLGNSGEELEVDVDRMLEDVPSFREAVDEDRERFAMEAAAQAKEQSRTSLTVAAPDVWEATSTNSDESFNWYYALGSWNYNQTGSVQVRDEGDSWGYLAETRVHVSKHYDWDPDKKVGPLGIFDQSELAELHCYGWAQEFWIKGSSDVGFADGNVTP